MHFLCKEMGFKHQNHPKPLFLGHIMAVPWSINEMVNPPVITIFIGGIVTIPSHGWFIIIVLPTLKYTCASPPPPLKGVGGTGALAHLFMTNSEDYYHGYTRQNHNNCAPLGSSASLGAPITHSRSFRSLACIAELCSAVLCSTLLFSTLLCSAHWI